MQQQKMKELYMVASKHASILQNNKRKSDMNVLWMYNVVSI